MAHDPPGGGAPARLAGRSGRPPATQDGRGGRHGLSPDAWKVVVVATIGSFMAQLDATIINVSLHGLALDLHASLATIQWVMSGYLLALALALPLNGWLVDRLGGKTVYLWCFAAFTLSSALCGIAWSAGSLIAFRILQGMSGGLLAPMAQLMVARVAGRNMPQVAGIMTMPILLAPLLGPVAAGALLQVASWRWLFFVNLPVGLLGFCLAGRFLRDEAGTGRRRGFDLVGLALLSPALVCFLYGADHVTTTSGLVALPCAGTMLALYAWTARNRGDGALVDLGLFRGAVFRPAAASMFIMNAVSFGGQMLIPIYLVRACGLSASRAGLLLVPLGLGMMCIYPFMGRLADGLGIRRLTGLGALLALAGTLPLVVLADTGPDDVVLLGSLFIRGVGIGAIGVPTMSAAYRSVPKRRLPTATTALNIVQRLGGPTGTTLVATCLAWRLPRGGSGGAAPDAFVLAFIVLCGLHGLLLLATTGLPRRLPEQTA